MHTGTCNVSSVRRQTMFCTLFLYDIPHACDCAMEPTLPIAMPRGMSRSTKRRDVADATLTAATIGLAFLSIGFELQCRRWIDRDVLLGNFDDDRLAAELAEVEQEITASFSQSEIDASSEGRPVRDPSTIDPMTPNVDGEFEVPSTATLQRTLQKGNDVLLASRLLFPVLDETWMALELAADVPAGAYAIEIREIIGRLAVHQSGGCLLVQVRFGGEWHVLVGAPRRPTFPPADAPLVYRVSVPHPFDGMRLLASTSPTAVGSDQGSSSGGRLSLRHLGTPLPTPPPPPPQKRSRFLLFELDRGFGAAHLGLFNGIALAWLLNVTAVLPRIHTYHDLETGLRRADASASSAFVPFETFFDAEAFISALSPMVRVVRRLPAALDELADHEVTQPVAFINPAVPTQMPGAASSGGAGAGGASALGTTGGLALLPTDLQRLWDHYKTHNVLRVRSLARKLVWSTPALAHLRLLLHAATRPAAAIDRLAAHLEREMLAFGASKNLSGSFVSMHLPLGSGWEEFCRQERLSTLGDGHSAMFGGASGASARGRHAGSDVDNESDRRRCDLSAEAVTQVLEERQVGDLSRLLYVAGTLNISHIQQLHKQRFAVMSRARFTVDIHPDLAPAVDMALCRRAPLFIGNAFSSFSFVLREARLAVGESERAMYYNADHEATTGDLTPEEALRWNVLPWVP